MRPHVIVFVLEVSPDHVTGQVTAYLRNHVTHQGSGSHMTFPRSRAHRDLVRSLGFVTVAVVEVEQEEVPAREEEDPNSWVPNPVTSQETD